MEQVVLLDESGQAIGVADKATVHTADTPLHLAFSCYLFNERGELLLTQRALHKKTWPGIWTNSCCGHPAPGESIVDSVRRRLWSELGIEAARIDLLLPGFRYRAIMGNGIVENEMCPVFIGSTTMQPQPDSDEVADARWIRWTDFTAQLESGELDISPWCQLQMIQLRQLGADPSKWPVGQASELPAAAR
jgi:isopentenyl-diphosphate Delta-isomerase